MQQTQTFDQTLVLLGGGHTHALLLRGLSMKPWLGVRIILISNVSDAPYSGLVPDLIAGDCSFEDSHIDLRALAQQAGAEFILAEVSGLNTKFKTVQFLDRPEITFDFLSINVGGSPQPSEMTRSFFNGVAVKPVPLFLKYLNEKLSEAVAKKAIIVGAGAGGVEIAFALRRKLGPDFNIELRTRGNAILASHNLSTQKSVRQALSRLKIEVIDSASAAFMNDDNTDTDIVIHATQVLPPAWLKGSGLSLDEKGFINTNINLQSVNHPTVFACGDVINFNEMNLPKSGVIAVRQAPALKHNLHGLLFGKALISYRPQRRWLSLISVDSHLAIASYGKLSYSGRPVLKLKRWIDRRFMKKFVAEIKTDNDTQFECLGCAAKVNSQVLRQVTEKLHLQDNEDACELELPPGTNLVQSIDYFPAHIADPCIFGRIATLHAFSDLFARGATPHSALVLAQLPKASDAINAERLFQMMSGVRFEIEKMSAKIVGGHTARGEHLALGITANGFAKPNTLQHKTIKDKTHVLILTKALGTGVLFAAEMQKKSKARWLDAAIESQLLSNQGAAKILQNFKVSACTDVTGFGLIGHMLEMLKSTSLQAVIDLNNIPWLAGALECGEKNIQSSLFPDNFLFSQKIENFERTANTELLFDPQTSGGLLAAVPAELASACVAELKKAGYTFAAQIAVFTEKSSVVQKPLRLRS